MKSSSKILSEKTKDLRDKMQERKINEADEKALRRSKEIARVANRIGRQLITAKSNEIVGLQSSLLLLNQAQAVVSSHFKEATVLLATAKRISKMETEEDEGN